MYNTVYEIKRKCDVWSRAPTLNKYFLVLLELYNINSITCLTIFYIIAICNKFYIFFFLSIQQSSELYWYSKKHMMCRYTLLLSAGILAILLANRGEKCFVQGLPISETYGESFCFYLFFIFFLQRWSCLHLFDGYSQNNLMTKLSIKLSSISRRKFVTSFTNYIIYSYNNRIIFL